MNVITAYQCSHCDKVYAWKDTAKSHERKCYWNPATLSCASCAFLDLLRVELAPGYFTEYQICLMNNDVTDRLKTGCEHYHQAEFHQECDFKINIPDVTFDRELALKRLAEKIDRMKQLHEEHQTEIQAAEDAMGLEANADKAINLP